MGGTLRIVRTVADENPRWEDLTDFRGRVPWPCQGEGREFESRHPLDGNPLVTGGFQRFRQVMIRRVLINLNGISVESLGSATRISDTTETKRRRNPAVRPVSLPFR
jgi:hypothetical protein